jgi:hypothetical protein
MMMMIVAPRQPSIPLVGVFFKFLVAKKSKRKEKKRKNGTHLLSNGRQAG